MNRSPCSAKCLPVNKPDHDQPIPVARRAGTLDPAEAWLGAVVDVLRLGPLGLLSGLPRTANRLLL